MLAEIFELLLRPLQALIRKRRGKARRSRRREEIRKFYRSVEWKRVRFDVLIQQPRCTLCGVSAKEGARLNVDHIQPLSKRWDLRLELSNLQTLCASCNWGKGGR